MATDDIHRSQLSTDFRNSIKSIIFHKLSHKRARNMYQNIPFKDSNWSLIHHNVYKLSITINYSTQNITLTLPYVYWINTRRISLKEQYKQRVLMHGHHGWNVRHGLCHIYMIYVYIWVVYSFCLFCCLFIIVTTQFVALYKPCKPKP